MGVSPSRLLGREPREVTEYAYDGDRLIGSVTTREPEFSRDHLDLLLAHERLEADRGSHGQPMSEATDPSGDPAKKGGWRYEANRLPRVDFAAKALADQQDAFYKKWPKASRNGHLWYVKRVDD